MIRLIIFAISADLKRQIWGGDSTFYADLIVAIVGSIIGAFVVIYLFYRQIRLDKYIEIKRLENERDEKLKYFADVIRNVINDLEAQITSAKIISKKIKQEPLQIPLLSQTGVKDLNRIIYILDQEKFYHAFLAKYNWQPDAVKNFRNIYSHLDYFDASLKAEIESLDKKVKYDYERKVRYKNLVEESMEKIDLLILYPPFGDTDYLQEAQEILISFRKSKGGDKGISHYQEGFILIIAPILHKKRTDSIEIAEILMLIKKAHLLYDEISKQNMVISQDFEKWIQGMGKALNAFRQLTYTLRKEN
jgi:hypothetical protein